MLSFAGAILSFLSFSIEMFCHDQRMKVVLYGSMFYNLYLFLRTLLGNPGIDPSIFKFYLFVENGGSLVKSWDDLESGQQNVINQERIKLTNEKLREI